MSNKNIIIFFFTYNICSLVKFPIDSGRGPLKLLPYKYLIYLFI